MSDYQGIYSIVGPPGTGKTSRCAQTVDRIVKLSKTKLDTEYSPVIVSSLTKAAASEAAARCGLPDHAVGTIHSFGMRSQDAPGKVVSRKHVDDWNTKHRFGWTMSGDSLGGHDDLAKKERLRGDSLLENLDLARHKMEPRIEWAPELREFDKAWKAWKEDLHLCDYTDMIECAGWSCPMGAGVVIADEAQDCSALEMRCLRRWGESAGALIFLGDHRQALYTWRGADPYAMVADDIPDSHRDTLHQSWRLPRAVYQQAESWATQLMIDDPPEYSPRDEEGLCVSSGARAGRPMEAIQHAVEKARDGHTCMIMATCGYHLIDTVQALREMSIPFSNPWRRKRGDWNPLAPRKKITSTWDRILSLVEQPSKDKLWTKGQVYQWASWMQAKDVIRYGQKKRLESWRGNRSPAHLFELSVVFEADVLQHLWRIAYDHHDRGELLRWWQNRLIESHAKAVIYPINVALEEDEELFDKHGEPRIYVGTCHSFKGAEADCVWLFPDLSPSAYDGLATDFPERHDSVVRTFYVGMTRAKQELRLCQSSGLAVEW